MNKRNVQTFLMVSAAFFAMSAPVRLNPRTIGSLTNAVMRTAEMAPARAGTSPVEGSAVGDEDRQRS